MFIRLAELTIDTTGDDEANQSQLLKTAATILAELAYEAEPPPKRPCSPPEDLHA